MHAQVKLPLIEAFYDKGVRSKQRFRGYFLYRTGPTNWRENWRRISGFKLVAFERTFTLCVWKQEGLYSKP